MYKLNEIMDILKNNKSYVIFCYGSSVFSNLIMAMTKKTDDEEVPSHILLKHENMIIECSSENFEVGDRKIHEGVRIYTVNDFITNELGKQTKYNYKSVKVSKNHIDKIKQSLNKKYSYKTIEDYIFARIKNRDGFICSGFINHVYGLINSERQPTPADILRKIGKDKGEK